MWRAYSIPENCWFDDPPISAAFHLAGGVHLEPTPDWVKDGEASKYLSWSQRENVENSQLAFSMAYEADAVGTPDPNWRGSRPKSIQSVVDEKFALAAFALWLSKPSPLSCGTVLHFDCEGDPASIRQTSSLYPILVMEQEALCTPTIDDLKLGGEVLEKMLTVDRQTSLWTAIQMMLMSLRERKWELRYLLQWIALEALFGPEEPNETTFRLSHRVALFLSDNLDERRQTFRDAKVAYRWRSKIVHGGRLGKLSGEKSLELSENTEGFLRKSFRKIFLTSALLARFEGDREQFLDDLALGTAIEAVKA